VDFCHRRFLYRLELCASCLDEPFEVFLTRRPYVRLPEVEKRAPSTSVPNRPPSLPPMLTVTTSVAGLSASNCGARPADELEALQTSPADMAREP